MFEREISDGTVSYRLWRSDRKPDISIPTCRRMITISFMRRSGLSGFLCESRFLSDRPRRIPCGCRQGLYGNKDARNDYFDNLRKKSGVDAVLEAVQRERGKIMLLGSDPNINIYIKQLFDNNVACFRASKNRRKLPRLCQLP